MSGQLENCIRSFGLIFAGFYREFRASPRLDALYSDFRFGAD